MDHAPQTRRDWIRTMIVAGLGARALAGTGAFAMPQGDTITIYKDPNCGCCKQWVTHLDANGFKTVSHDRTDMNTIKDSMGVPNALRSCHTAVVGKLVVEGHVPAADIRKALKRTPKGVLGLAVPGMPAGSPGMEMGGRKDRYDVIAFDASGGTKVFATHS